MNMLKTKLTLIALLLTVSGLKAQTDADLKSSGLYLTEDDYRNNKLSHVAETDAQNFIEVRLHNLLLIRNGAATKFRFGSVYGYFQNGSKYRAYRSSVFFSDYGYYKVMDDSGLIIYSKVSSPHKSPGHKWYYYSEAYNTDLFRITEQTIKDNFQHHPEFVKKLCPAIQNQEFLNRDEKGGLLINSYYNSHVKK